MRTIDGHIQRKIVKEPEVRDRDDDEEVERYSQERDGGQQDVKNQ